MTLPGLVVLPVLVLTGCASSTGTAAVKASSTSASPKVAASDTDADIDTDAGSGAPTGVEQQPLVCADKTVAKTLPADFPKDFPLPAGIIVTGTQELPGDQLIVTAVSREAFSVNLTFFQTKLPAAGIVLSGGEVEKTDSESNFTAATYRGRWQLRQIPQCTDQTQITVLTAPK